jgi:hypothetical protein
MRYFRNLPAYELILFYTQIYERLRQRVFPPILSAVRS